MGNFKSNIRSTENQRFSTRWTSALPLDRTLPEPDPDDYITGSGEDDGDGFEEFIDATITYELRRYDRYRPWSDHAEPLAEWANSWLVNRRDCHGAYYDTQSGVKPKTAKNPLTHRKLVAHFRATSANDVIGLHCAAQVAGECFSRWIALDIDRHSDSVDAYANLRAALHWHDAAAQLGLNPLLLESNGRGGYHLYIIFDRPIPTAHAFSFGKWLIRDWEQFELDQSPEAFPKSPGVRDGGFGTWVRLPGRHHKRFHYPQVWNGRNWLADDEAVEAILRTDGVDPCVMPAEAIDYTSQIRQSNLDVICTLEIKVYQANEPFGGLVPPKPQVSQVGVVGSGGTRRRVRRSRTERVIAFLNSLPPAIQESRGSDDCFLACFLAGPGFDLTPEYFLDIIKNNYNSKCIPPWTEAELRKKVDDAYRTNKDRGFLI